MPTTISERPLHLQAVRNPVRWRASTLVGMVVLALLPVVPMPIAGGTPIAITLVGLLTAAQILGVRGAKLDGADVLLVMIATALLMFELTTVMITSREADVEFALARVYWIVLLLVTIAFTNTEISRDNTKFILGVLSIGLGILLSAMLVESLFYPSRESGREFGPVQLPMPRATGVPNSDGKIGTFLVICLCVALFYGKVVPRWLRHILLVGPFAGLFFIQSRSGLLAFLAVFLFHWIYRSLSFRNALVVVARWIVIFCAGLFILNSVGEIFLNLLGEGVLQRNVVLRQSLTDYALREIGNAPLLGSGSEAIYNRSNGQVIHNTVLAMSVKSGLFAGLLIAAIILYPAMAFRGNLQFTFFKFALVAGFVTEHMLYPGFINEFLIIGYVTAKWAWRFSPLSPVHQAPPLVNHWTNGGVRTAESISGSRVRTQSGA